MKCDIGEKFGMLTVVSERLKRKSGKQSRMWYTVECECGAVKEVLAQNIRNGKTKSCGCKSNEWKAQASYRHGLWGASYITNLRRYEATLS